MALNLDEYINRTHNLNPMFFHKQSFPLWIFQERTIYTPQTWRNTIKSKWLEELDDEEKFIEKKMEEISSLLLYPPSPLTFLILKTEFVCSFGEKGECWVSRDGGFNWKSGVVCLKPFCLTVNNHHDGEEPETYDTFFSFLYTSIPLTPGPHQFTGFSTIRFFIKDKKTVDIRASEFSQDKIIRHWSNQCDLFWKLAYTKPELVQKQTECEKYRPLISRLHDVCLQRYIWLAKVCKRLKVGGDKVRQGRMTSIKEDSSNESVFCVLFPHFIEIKDDLKKKGVFIVLKFACLTEENDTTFTITTPRNRYTFQVTHETAKEEWTSTLKKCMSSALGNSNPLAPPTSNNSPPSPFNHYIPPSTFQYSIPPTTASTTHSILTPNSNNMVQGGGVDEDRSFRENRHSRTKPLANKLLLIVKNLNGEMLNGKPIKLKGPGPWRIGRSRDNNVTLNDEGCHISRTHCEIEVIDNNVYIKDLGSAAGTFLNGKSVAKAPLKPGDVIRVGGLQLVLQVKSLDKTFVPTSNKEKKKKPM